MKLRMPRLTWEIPMLCVLFCFAVSLFNLAGYIFAAIVAVMLVIKFTKIRLCSMELLLILFSVSYSVVFFFHNGIDINGIIWYLIGPWAAYLYGRLFMQKANIPYAFLAFIVVLAMGMFLHGMLNLLAYVTSDYTASYAYYRLSVDFWRGTIVNVNTTGMYYTFAVGLSIGLLFSRVSAAVKSLCVVVVSLSLAMSVFFANRALLIVAAVLIAWQLLRMFCVSDISTKKKIGILIGFVMALLLIFLLMELNVGGMRDWYSSLKVVQRFQNEGVTNRFKVWSYFFKDNAFVSHLFGGNQMLDNAEVNYFHNMWLDVYHSVGIIPFAILALITLKAVAAIVRTSRTMKKNGHETSATLFQCMMVAAVLNCAVEPIIEGNPYFFLIMLMFLGASDGYCRQLSTKNREGVV